TSPEGCDEHFLKRRHERSCTLVAGRVRPRHHLTARRLMPFESYNPYMTLQSYIPFMPLKTYAAQHETPVAPDPRAAAQSPALVPQGARVGKWGTLRGAGTPFFRYEESWANAPQGRALSLSLPVTADREVRGQAVEY